MIKEYFELKRKKEKFQNLMFLHIYALAAGTAITFTGV